LKNKDIIISEVNKKIIKEIKFINNYYDYDIKRFFCPSLLYGLAFLSFFNIEEIPDFKLGVDYIVNNHFNGKKNTVFFNTYKVLNLITGIELLSIGLDIHSSGENTFKQISKKTKNLEKIIEKNYTIELLFGDIFFSRSVSYLMDFDDFIVFGNILRSILSLHQARIIVHSKVKNLLSSNREAGVFFERDMPKVKNINALLKEVFYLGIGVSNYDLSLKNSRNILSVIENIVMIKTYNDILNYIKQSLKQPLTGACNSFFNDFSIRINSFKKKAKDAIKLIESKWLRDNFLCLFERFE